MRKDFFETLPDDYLNFYLEWVFVRSFEYTALITSMITWYKLFANIDRKTWFIFLESSFPKSQIKKVENELKIRWYSLRYVDKIWLTQIIDLCFWKVLFQKTNLMKSFEI